MKTMKCCTHGSSDWATLLRLFKHEGTVSPRAVLGLRAQSRTGDILSGDNSKRVALEIMSSGGVGKVAELPESGDTKRRMEDGWGPCFCRPG